ncbi:uncharacterized protein LOC144168483 [Haemaphysalis longicornis]
MPAMAKVIIACVLALSLATAVFAGDFLCGLNDEDLSKTIDCIHKNVKPEVADFMARLPSKGQAFIRKVCSNGGSLKELLPYLHTPDFLDEWKKATEKCEIKP